MCQQRFEHAAYFPRDGSRLEPDAQPDMILDERYRLVRKVGEGSMGEVHQAEHIFGIAKRLVMKVTVTSNRSLQHPHVVQAETQPVDPDGHALVPLLLSKPDRYNVDVEGRGRLLERLVFELPVN